MTEARQKTILVMDDSLSVLKLAVMKLQKAGYAVDAVSTVDQLVSAVKTRVPDLALIDVNMPEVFGYDLVGYLRDVLQVKQPILLFSSLDQVNLERLVKHYRADGYLQKSLGLFTLPEQLGQFFVERSGGKRSGRLEVVLLLDP